MKLVRLKRVLEITGLSRTTIWRLERAGEFPKCLRITDKSVAWLESDIQDWIQSKIYMRKKDDLTSKNEEKL